MVTFNQDGGEYWAVVAHAFNPSTQEAEDLCEFEASLVTRASSRTESKATEKPCLKKQQQKDGGEIMCHPFFFYQNEIQNPKWNYALWFL